MNSDPLALVQVRSPEWGILEMHSFYMDILAVGYIYKSGSEFFQICALRVDFPAKPERLPITLSVTVDSSSSFYGESVDALCVDQGGEVLYASTFKPGIDDLEIGYVIAAFQGASTPDFQTCARPEEQGT